MSELSPHHQARLREFGLDCARRARRADGRDDIVVLGDSLVERTPLPDGWVNRGIDGDRLRFAAGDVFDRVGTDALHPNPRAIVVLIGINDLVARSDAVSELAGTYEHLLAQLAMRHAEAKLAVVSLLPTSGPLASMNAPIVAMNARLRDLASARGAEFWDIHAALVDPKTGAAASGTMSSDGIHPSKRGAGIITAFYASHATSLVGAHGPRLADGAVDTLTLGQRIIAKYGRECWGTRVGSDTDDDVIRNFIQTEADYLTRYIQSGAHLFRDLYLGSRVKFIAKNEAVWSALPGGLSGLADQDAHLWTESVTRQGAAPDVIAQVTAAHTELRRFFTVGSPTRIKLLFIGDCLLEDVELLMGADLLRQGLLADVDFIVSKNPSDQLKEIRAAAANKYDGIVYAPLTWEFDQDFRNVFSAKLQTLGSVDEDIKTITERIEKRVRLLADLFECNIFVHNTAGVLRASSTAKRIARSAATRYKRENLRRKVGAHLDALLAEINNASFDHLFLVDELGAVHDNEDDVTLGRFLYYHDAIHPAELSVVVAKQITNYVSASVRLAGKKVVVCDLDNTLWDGVIGEGLGVRHCKDRQQILLELKRRGIVLAIASKNDPANVKWENSWLTAEDFVASEISWGPKAAGIARMAEELNLKAKDFIFIDDRADERSMVSETFAKLVALDPCVEETWRMFATWGRLLGTKPNADRTEMYKQRAERQKLLDATNDEAEAIETFKKLQLRLDIRRSSDGDLKRIHELINRTNQWNLQGSRCSFAEVKAWHESDDFRIYSARVKDKFGDMGLISVIVAEFKPDALDVNIGVLSCRVFGYGVETLLLRRLEQDAVARYGAPSVRGYFISTPHNGPSKDFFARHGYVEQDGAWRANGQAPTAPDPTWFEKVTIEA